MTSVFLRDPYSWGRVAILGSEAEPKSWEESEGISLLPLTIGPHSIPFYGFLYGLVAFCCCWVMLDVGNDLRVIHSSTCLGDPLRGAGESSFSLLPPVSSPLWGWG